MDSNGRSASPKLRFDIRAAFAVLALALASCQGLDSGAGGLGGGTDMAPPVQNPGALGASPGAIGGPTTGPNGQEELTNPGSTLAPNEAQYPVGQGPQGMKCPLVQQVTCTISFNLPHPTPSPSSSPAAGGSPKSNATPSPTASPTATASGADPDDADDTPTPSPSPPGTITMQMEPLPKDLPAMTNPDPRLMHVMPVIAIRMQSDTNFALNGGAQAVYSLPATLVTGHVFTLQLYNESTLHGKRVDQFLGSYSNWTGTNGVVSFAFNVPKVTVRSGQIWLLALYGATLPPGSTPTPSPTPVPTTSPSPSPSATSS